MCEASAFIVTGNKQELLMEAVDTIESEADQLRLKSIFGEQKMIKGKIHSLSLVDHKIFIVRD
jgi:predicted RNA-binding protein